MSTDQILVLTILAATVAMFLWGRWRHDMVAVAALLACVLAGIVAVCALYNREPGGWRGRAPEWRWC